MCDCVKGNTDLIFLMRLYHWRKDNSVEEPSLCHLFIYTQLQNLRSQLRGSIFILYHSRSSYVIYFIYIILTHLSPWNIWNHNWPAPNVRGFTTQLVSESHWYREVTGSNPVEVLNFCQASLRNCINCVHNYEDQSSIHCSQTKHFEKERYEGVGFIKRRAFNITYSGNM